MSEYHNPVMLNECIEGLNINPDGIYVDVTFGGGGHSKEILKHLDKGHLYAFDQDKDALKNAEGLDKSKFTLINANFRHLKRYLKFYKVEKVDGLLADLGVSSHQFNVAERGFSTRFDGPLDMRMNKSEGVTAADVVNTYEVSELHKIFGMYGELKNARTLAQLIEKARKIKKIETIEEFKHIIKPCTPKGKENKYWAQVFQALRIEVNDEMKALEEMILQSAEVIKEGGRLVVMSYHSLEDRPVKNFLKQGKLHGQVEKDFYGNMLKPFKEINRKPIISTKEELALNNRARSAKLRIAERSGFKIGN